MDYDENEDLYLTAMERQVHKHERILIRKKPVNMLKVISGVLVAGIGLGMLLRALRVFGVL